jgi:hypothetical protein
MKQRTSQFLLIVDWARRFVVAPVGPTSPPYQDEVLMSWGVLLIFEKQPVQIGLWLGFP